MQTDRQPVLDPMNPGPCLIEAAALADPTGLAAAPGALLVRRAPGAWPMLHVLAAGAPEQVNRHPAAARAERIDLPDAVLLPALVNAHAHLDLTAIGPQPFNEADGFATWLDFVRTNRPAGDEAIAAAVAQGVEASLCGGVAAVGDIGGEWSTVPLRVLRESPLRGASFVECFGLGPRQQESIRRLEAILADADAHDRGVTLGVQPHAPYSAGPDLYRAAAGFARAGSTRLATHLAESLAERQLITEGDGPLRDLLESLGLWNEAAAADVLLRRHPVDAVLDAVGDVALLAAHVNDAPPGAIRLLARSRATVVYCPRAAAYFGQERALGRHRYQEMAAAGVRVALGTDSIINLPVPEPGEPSRISTLDEMRFLRRRDGASSRLLLSMATINGAAALGLDPSQFDLQPGDVAGVIAVPLDRDDADTADPIDAALRSIQPPRFL